MSLLLLSMIALAAPTETATVEVDISGVRNARGEVHLCATREPKHFPDCRHDPNAYRLSVKASTTRMRLAGIVPGSYALSLIHDENSNARLDTFMGMPREGFGFSRNPVIRFGPPTFAKVKIDIGPGITRTSVRMQYLL